MIRGAILTLLAVLATAAVAVAQPTGDVMMFHARCSGQRDNNYVYYLFSTANYTIQTGDVLEYDVYINPICVEPKISLDMQYKGGGALRDAGAVDQNGTPVHAEERLEAAVGKWFHRRIRLDGSAGKTIERWDLVCESNPKGENVAYYANIVITNGGSAVFTAWQAGQPTVAKIDWARGYNDKSCGVELVTASDTYPPYIDPERYLPIELRLMVNSNAIGPEGNMDGDGLAFDSATFPRGVTQVDGTPFQLPDTNTGNDSVACDGQKILIEMPADGPAAAIHLLAAAAVGDASGDFTILDSKGNAERVPVAVSDWCNRRDESPRLAFDNRVKGAEQTGPKVFAWKKSVRTLAEAGKPMWLVLPNEPRIRVFAITVEAVPDYESDPAFASMLLERFQGAHPRLATYMANWRYAASLRAVEAGSNDKPLIAMYAALRDGDNATFESILSQEESKLTEATKSLKDYTITYVGNAHIDMAWLWQVPETQNVCRDTWTQAVKFMDEFPQFTFAQSQAAGYTWMKDLYPDLYKKMQAAHRAGKWEVVGGAWVEPDNNMPCGEAQVRQYLYGKRFFQREFGVDVRVAWLPDSFGFDWNLPQIWKKCGIDYFMTTKLGWNDTTQFPYNLFTWQAPDGSTVLAFQTIGGYGPTICKPQRRWKRRSA